MSNNDSRHLILPDTVTTGQEDLDYTSKIRRAVISEIISDKSNVSDPKVGGLLAKLVDGIDKQVFNRRRADAADAMAKGIGDLAGALDKLVIKGGISFSRPPDDEEVEYREVEVPDLPEVDLPEGVLDPVGSNVDVVKLMQDDFERRRREAEEANE